VVRWSKLRDKLRKGEWYAFSVLCFIAGVVAGKGITVLGRAEPVLVLTGVGAVLLAYWVALLIATIAASVREEA